MERGEDSPCREPPAIIQIAEAANKSRVGVGIFAVVAVSLHLSVELLT